jgi:nicotinamide mononucleotide transporter
MGFYGYYIWSEKSIGISNESSSLTVSEKGIFFHVFCIIITSVLALVLAWFFNSYTDADWPYLDAFTTMFSFLATYLEAKKVLSGWVYWIVINGLTIGLYYNKDLDYYSGLTLIYFIMSFVGYFKWKKEMV